MSKHFILTSGRSGSNFLSSLLSNHPHVVNYGEVLGPWTTGYKVNKYLVGRGDASAYLDFIYRGKGYYLASQGYARLKAMKAKKPFVWTPWSQIQSYGVKDFAMNLNSRGAGDYLLKHPEIKVINLYRDNALRRLASVKLLDETGMVANTGETMVKAEAKRSIYLPVNSFWDELTRTEAVVKEQLEMVAKLPPEQVLSIRYEDLFASAEAKQNYANQVLNFLGVSRVDLNSQHKKLNPDNLHELIENYDEIFALCQGKPAERYFSY